MSVILYTQLPPLTSQRSDVFISNMVDNCACVYVRARVCMYVCE